MGIMNKEGEWTYSLTFLEKATVGGVTRGKLWGQLENCGVTPGTRCLARKRCWEDT